MKREKYLFHAGVIKTKATLSIIIPVLNEKERVFQVIDHLCRLQDDEILEIIVVDGNHRGTPRLFWDNRKVITLQSEQGRSRQMNRGAEQARGDILLFLHGDTFLPSNAAEQIRNVMGTKRYVAGAFDLGFDNHRRCFHIIAAVASMRSRITRIPFGDQAIFVQRHYFEKIGGFDDIPLMEDIELMKKIKKRRDRIRIMPLKVTTSARKWEAEGILRATLRNWLLQFFYYCGVSPEKLVRYYYKQEGL